MGDLLKDLIIEVVIEVGKRVLEDIQQIDSLISY